MSSNKAGLAEAAEVVLPCTEFDATLAFFTGRLGFRLEQIFPADDPVEALVTGYGLRLRFQRGAAGAPGVLRLNCRDSAAIGAGARALSAPNGTRIELIEADPALELPPLAPDLVVAKADDGTAWTRGRAGMLYRDLLPGRLGGRIIASHIRIPDGGPVPDSVHFHKIRFQMIYCRRGWVRVVYQDQGPPFVLRAGDCVLQPPEIRHRVLESSAGLEVIEIGCPAEHLTCLDHDLTLPTPVARPARDYGGQRFVRHRAADAAWRPWRLDGFEARDSGIGAATDGLGGVRMIRRSGAAEARACRHDAELLFLFVLDGKITVEADGHGQQALTVGDALTLPAGLAHRLADGSDDLELLEVTMPAAFETATLSDPAL